MLSVRNVILAASLLLIVSLLASVLTMLQTPDSGGLGNDTFGTRGQGYRGLFEILAELGTETSRSLAPPDGSSLSDETFVLLGPNPQLAGFEPSYLHRLREWIDQGGRLVVAPRDFDLMSGASLMNLDELPPTVLESLGLTQVQLSYAGSTPHENRRPNFERDRSAEAVAREIFEDLTGPPPALIEVSVEVDDELAPHIGNVTRLQIPEESLATLIIGEETESEEQDGVSSADREDPPVAAGRLFWTDEDNEQHTLVARFVHGKGEIIVVSDPQLFANRLIAGADNSILAVNLLSPDGRPVSFDEFYHGLGVRGSPLYLLTRMSYATVTLGLLFFLGVWTWREAVFLGPPLADTEASRRDISEYIDAMGRFFSVGSSGRGRLVEQVRDGVLRQISNEAGLPPDAGDVEHIASVIARRDIHRSEMLLESIRSVDTALQTRRHWSESQTLDAMQRMTDCLSKKATGPFGLN
ncbi:MAG: DUF4350 domain-containing protein [Planctomycetaceae bacterium]